MQLMNACYVKPIKQQIFVRWIGSGANMMEGINMYTHKAPNMSKKLKCCSAQTKQELPIVRNDNAENSSHS